MPKLSQTQRLQQNIAAELRKLEAQRVHHTRGLSLVSSHIALLQKLQKSPEKTKRAPAKKAAPVK